MELSDATMRSKSSHLMKIKWKKRCENPLHCYCIFTNMRIFCTNNKFQREQQIQPTRSFARDNYEILLSIRLMQLLYMKWCHFDESPTQRDGVSHSYHPQLSVALDTLIVVVVLFISHVYVYRCIQSNVIKKEIVWYCILIRQLNKIPCLWWWYCHQLPLSVFLLHISKWWLCITDHSPQVDCIKHFNQTDWNEWR